MNDFYIKLTNEAAMPTALSAFYNEEGELVSNTADYAIDVVGTLYDATGVTLTGANEMDYPEMLPITGWHLNIRLMGDAHRDYVEELSASYGVLVNSPNRVWL
tara:strand:+ start:1047 stop:1355 length:309 start_codon:yes stop_codon:yes gene_type:complete